MCARDGDLLALAPVLFVFAFVTRNAFSQSQSSAGRPARLCRTKILVRRVGPRAASAGAMAAQPPPRPTPNNLLFCGPPPTLPQVLLLPNESTRNVTHSEPALIADNQTNDTDALREINNVGVPTYEGIFHDQVQVFDDNQNIEYQLPPENFLRRTHSFDVSDIYAAQIVNQTDLNVFRHRRSEPDLSKYGLFAEVSAECASQQMQHPALVLNNPFYDGSYALDPHQINQTMVVLPENYLAFEDSFVPTWDYKPGFIIDREINTEMYCDGLPLIPTSNDPWSVYCNDFTAFQYFSPHYEAPLGEDTIHYTPLTDLDYALPQYMSLPVIEQANVENNNNHNNVEVANVSSVKNEPIKKHDKESNLPKTDVPAIDSVVSNVVIEDDKTSAPDIISIKESSTQSEESLNADISNDVTSSLAFIPSSKSSQRPDAADDTSEDTSPCSTDYHEASALDLVQSLDELSCCDSTDYSQSREDISPTIPELPKTSNAVKKENQDIVPIVSNATNISNLPLHQVPSIPLHDLSSGEMISIQKTLPEKEPVQTNVNAQQVSQRASIKNLENVVKQDVTKVINTQQCITNSQTISELSACDNNHIKVIDNALKTSQQPPFPPAVPSSWLAPRPSGNQVNLVPPPQIRVQNADGVVSNIPQSPKVVSHPAIKISQSSTEPQPSCSYVPAQPGPALQLKPEKQTKEVEVSLHIIIVH